MKLFDALNISGNEIVALVGGGGKTTTMFALGREARDRGLKTVLTTTTRIYSPDDPELAVAATRDSRELFSIIRSKLTSHATVVAGAELGSDNKLTGLDPHLIPGILDTGANLVIVEADGAARKPFKAPASHEPVIPDASTVVIPVVGVDCLGWPLHPDYVHRPEIAAKLSGINLGDMVTAEVVARVLTHPLGFLKGLPPNSRWIPLINKVETDRALEQAREIARLVGKIMPCRVLIGAVGGTNPVVELLDFN